MYLFFNVWDKSRTKTYSPSEILSQIYHLYLVVVGVETLDEVDAEDDVDAELEVEALIRK